MAIPANQVNVQKSNQVNFAASRGFFLESTPLLLPHETTRCGIRTFDLLIHLRDGSLAQVPPLAGSSWWPAPHVDPLECRLGHCAPSFDRRVTPRPRWMRKTWAGHP